MTVAALTDAGADRNYIEEELKRIKLEPFALEWNRVIKRGISSLKFDVIPDPGHPPKHYRHYSDIVQMIDQGGFQERVTALSLAIFEKIAAAEGKIHGIPVHIHIDHGTYPVPAPATLEMMRGLPIAASDIRMELTTPTGAGVIAVIVDEFSLGIPPMTVESIGYGAGTRDMQNQPNVLRAVVGTIQDASHHRHSHSHKHGSGEQERTHGHDLTHDDAHGHDHDHGHNHPHK